MSDTNNLEYIKSLVNVLKANSKRYLLELDTIYPIQTNNGKKKHRFVTYDLNTVILELIKCIYNTSQKRTKRLKRLDFLLSICDIGTRTHNKGCTINEDTYKKIKKVKKEFGTQSNNILSNIFSFNIIPSIFSENINYDNQPSIFLLKQETNTDIDNDNITSLKKFNKNDYYFQAEKQVFHNHCKDILNADGYVYDIFTYVIIISFYKLITTYMGMHNNDKVTKMHQKILDNCYITFKGGTAIAKHIINNNIDIFNSLDNNAKLFLHNDFIKGGDNDTSLMLYKEAFLYDDITDVNNALKDIMTFFPIVLNETLLSFHIEETLYNYIKNITDSNYTYDNVEFLFKNTITQSYIIDDDPTDNELLKKINYVFETDNQLYHTMSYLEFDDNDGNTMKFYLSRIKCGFISIPIHSIVKSLDESTDSIENKDDILEVLCYAECLDISCPCIDSVAVVENPTYINITDDHILFKPI